MVKHKPPSRIRYEESHPTISFRLHKDLKSRLEKVLEKESFADFVKEALGKREREKESLEYKYKKGYTDGYQVGYKQGSRDYAFYTYCAICGRKIMLGGEEDREEIDMYFRRKELCHAWCIEKEERGRRRDYY